MSLTYILNGDPPQQSDEKAPNLPPDIYTHHPPAPTLRKISTLSLQSDDTLAARHQSPSHTLLQGGDGPPGFEKCWEKRLRARGRKITDINDLKARLRMPKKIITQAPVRSRYS